MTRSGIFYATATTTTRRHGRHRDVLREEAHDDRERKRESLTAHKNVDKMEELDASLFPQRSRAFAQTEGRLFGRFPFSSSDDSKNTHTRAFRRLSLVGLRNNTRDFFRSRRVRVSKHTHTPTSLSDLTPCLFSRPRRRRHWEEEKRAADGRV